MAALFRFILLVFTAQYFLLPRKEGSGSTGNYAITGSNAGADTTANISSDANVTTANDIGVSATIGNSMDANATTDSGVGDDIANGNSTIAGVTNGSGASKMKWPKLVSFH